ncbi:MAG: ATP-binding cassette domain-containing protein [Candidatus Stahlbacteria bacterium]|nr:ATP-binding cassette domain-containing protein [Candidatus Stahlbacteria bacterium]
MIEFIGVYKFNLRNLNFKIEDREFVNLVGQGGTGKTTILKLAYGEITPDRGTIVINPKSQTPNPNARLRIGYITQSNTFLEDKDVLTNLEFPLKFLGNHNRQEMLSVLNKLGLDKYCKSKVRDLPCSARQLLKIALSVVKNPILLLVDEPLANLDPDQSSTVLTLLKDMHSTGTTILLATSLPVQSETKELHLINDEIMKSAPPAAGFPTGFSPEYNSEQETS